MKLLTPLITKNLQADQTARELLRIQELNKASDQARKNLANAEADFNTTLAKNRTKWAIEEEEHSKRIKEIQKEIDDLEVKKVSLLIPINILESGTGDRMEQAAKYLAELRTREEYNDDLTDRLENELDIVGQRQQDLNEQSRKLILQEEGIERQKESTILGSKRLSEEMKNFSKIKEKSEEDIDRRKTEVFLLERSLLAKDQSLMRTDKALSALAEQLKDERGTLDRAFQEVKRMRDNILIEKN